MIWSRIVPEDTLLPTIPIVHVGCAGIDAIEFVGDAVITGSIVVPGLGVGVKKTIATTTITTTTRPAARIYGVRALFFFRTIRQFGQVVSPGVTGAPQRGQVFDTIYSSILFTRG
jgi:hypothetical protein